MTNWRQRFSLDLRSLALFRIALGLVLAMDFLFWVSDLSFFLTERGPYPLGAWVGDTYQGNLPFSLYGACTYEVWPYFLLAVTWFAILSLIAGQRLSWVTPILWILYVSLQNRSMVALDSGDMLARELLLLGIFLPWGSCWVWGSVTDAGALRVRPFWSAGVGLYLCLVTTHLFGFLARVFEWQNGDRGVFQPERLVLALPDGWLPYASWIGSALFALAAWQALGAILLVWTQARWRSAAIILLTLSGAFSAMAFDLGIAPLFGVVALVPWVPADFWRGGCGEAPECEEPSAFAWRTGLIGCSVLSYGALALLSYLPTERWPQGLEGWANFLGGAPRGGVVLPWPRQEFYHYLAVATDAQGREWQVDATSSLWEQTFRRRVYLHSLELKENWELRYWMALELFRQERRRLKGKGPKSVHLFQIPNKEEDSGSSSRRLWAEWPMLKDPSQR